MKTFSIDYRSLALFRIGLGLSVFYCAVTYFQAAGMFLVANGAISLDLLESHFGKSWQWSLNWLSQSAWYQYLLLCVTCIAGLLLALGWRTSWMTVLSWVLITSLLNAAPPTVGGGDILLNILLFWGMFLPLGIRWSFDERGKTALAEGVVTSMASAGIMIQMALMYLFTGFSKCNEVWYSGRALGIGLSNPRLTRPLGDILVEYPSITSYLTQMTLAAELFLPFLLLSPWKPKMCRSIALLSFLALHVGIELTMSVVLFSFTSIVGLTSFLPELWWKHTPLKQLQAFLDNVSGAGQLEPAKVIRRKRKNKKKLSQTKVVSFRARLSSAFLAFCLVYVFFYNVLVEFGTPEIRRALGSYQRFGEVAALKQYWNMFSDPSPLCFEVACVVQFRDKSQIDLLRNNAEVEDRYERPVKHSQYDSIRQMVFLTTLTYSENAIFRRPFMKYLCREYKKDNEKRNSELETCRLMYYFVGAHPMAKKLKYVEAARVQVR